MKRLPALFLAFTVLSSLLTVSASAADYSFTTTAPADYYDSTSYEEVYGSQYNYGGHNIVDYQIPELPYGSFSTTQTGVMEKIPLPDLQQTVFTTVPGGYGVTDAVSPVLPDGSSTGTVIPSTPTGSTLPPVAAFTALTEDFKLSNGAVGYISIPAIGIKKYYVWEGETTASMNKGVGHFSSTSVWDGCVGICGHNRGATYVIGKIKDLKVGDTVTYTTSQGTRTYEVKTVTTIGNSDWSYLQPTADNRITLITCVAGDSSRRWVVQAVEKT